MSTRIEQDFIGELEIPADALYGIHAARAKANFPDQTIFHIEWFKAMGLVKKACYQTAEAYEKAMIEKYFDHAVSGVAGQLSDSHFPYLIHAAAEIADGDHFDAFIVPAVSGGAGTSINMNVNEIIANVALLNLGEQPGSYHIVDPIEHANIFQSTNDVVPTALKVATMFLLQDLEKSINSMRFVVEQIETAHQNDLRIGYTQMQEAVPTSFGKLFSTYSEALSRDWWRVSKCFERIKMVNLGGSAIGTGMAVPRYFIMEAIGHLQQLTGLPVTRSENLADATCNLDSFVEIHATIKAHAVNLEKMVSDIRLLASDLTSSFTNVPRHASRVTRHENGATRHTSLSIPQCQVGSSIMPGKVNPVIPEFVISAAHRIYSNDQLISSLCAQGCLELNAYLPVIGHALLDSLKLLIACDTTLKKNLMEGLLVFSEQSRELLFRSPSITTALLPALGYHKASELAKFMKTNGIDVFEANRNLKLLTEEKLEKLLLPENLLKLGFTASEMTRDA
ncbi:MAG: lyase family protein [Bacteroidetes bacterium]|nr:lyase family protein [Bacteroidota bacterium]